VTYQENSSIYREISFFWRSKDAEVVAVGAPTATFSVSVDRPGDIHKLENIGICPRVGGRVLSGVFETVNGAYAKKQVQVLVQLVTRLCSSL